MSDHSRIEIDVEGRQLSLVHLDKVLYPETGFTKGEIIDYYARVGPTLLRHVRGRPLTRKRFPDGVGAKGFFEKQLPKHAPDWIPIITVDSSSSTERDEVDYPDIGELAAVVWLANMAAIELHVPLWHRRPNQPVPAAPDHMVFDLDPGPRTSVVECCRVALAIRDVIDGELVAKTSGSKGLQLYRPVRTDWERTRERALDIAQRLEKDQPDLVTSNMRKDLRPGRVLIDWSQNHPKKTTIAVYSLRATPTPRVSTPVTWDEVAACAEGGDPDLLAFDPDDVVERLDRLGDLFAPLALG